MLPSAKKISILVYSDSTAANDNWHCEHWFSNDFESESLFSKLNFNFAKNFKQSKMTLLWKYECFSGQRWTVLFPFPGNQVFELKMASRWSCLASSENHGMISDVRDCVIRCEEHCSSNYFVSINTFDV